VAFLFQASQEAALLLRRWVLICLLLKLYVEFVLHLKRMVAVDGGQKAGQSQSAGSTTFKKAGPSNRHRMGAYRGKYPMPAGAGGAHLVQAAV
jgi:hypothetical protein